MKEWIKAGFVIAAFAALIIGTSSEQKKVADGDFIRNVSDSSLRADILSSVTIAGLKEIRGVKVEYDQAGKISYYFEYEADPAVVLNAIASLPFRKDDNRSSVQCGLMNSETNPLEAYKDLPEQEFNAGSFFWKANPEEYTFYECLRSPMRHTMLVSKTSSRILHRIEVI